MTPAPTRPNPTPNQNFRRIVSRADATTLIGMVLLIASLFLPWATVQPNFPLSASNAAYIAAKLPPLSGFALPDWGVMAFCALGCGFFLLWLPDSQNRYTLFLAHCACALGGALIALRHFAVLPGMLLGLGSFLFLLWGALDRFQAAGRNASTPPA